MKIITNLMSEIKISLTENDIRVAVQEFIERRTDLDFGNYQLTSFYDGKATFENEILIAEQSDPQG